MAGKQILAPSFLVAVPQMLDPNFARTVVYLISHSEEGAFGLVINRMAPVTLREVAVELQMEGGNDSPVFIGGPVERTRGFVLHGRRDLAIHSEEVEDGIWITGDPEVFRTLLTEKDLFKFFLGYSGWAPGQLEEEISQGAWFVLPSKKEWVLSHQIDQMWNKVLREIGIDPGAVAPPGEGYN
jgi:putative transcriptional regulator